MTQNTVLQKACACIVVCHSKRNWRRNIHELWELHSELCIILILCSKSTTKFSLEAITCILRVGLQSFLLLRRNRSKLGTSEPQTFSYFATYFDFFCCEKYFQSFKNFKHSENTGTYLKMTDQCIFPSASFLWVFESFACPLFFFFFFKISLQMWWLEP